jgi:hypothetical protein
VTRKQLTDTEFDALVVRSLSRLPSYAPSRAFADKVMDRVALPSPKPVRAWQRARTWALQPRRALALAGAYACVASIALVVAVPWLLNNSPTLRFGFDWVVSRGAGVLRDVTIAVASWTVSSGIAGIVKSIPLSGPQVWALAFGATALYAGCAIGLHYLLRAPRDRNAPAQVQA